MSDQDSKFWSNAQTYSMAVICMILGIAAGYLLHAPAVASPAPSIGNGFGTRLHPLLPHRKCPPPPT